MEETVDIILKLVLVGDSGVGKTNLIGCFKNNDFERESKATIGVEFSSKIVEVEKNIIKAQIWDTAGQERYRCLTKAYYRGAVGVVVVFDLTCRNSYHNVDKWVEEAQQTTDCKYTVILLVGNKCDLVDQRQVDQREASDYARKHAFTYIETSALTAANVEEAFIQIIKQTYKNMKMDDYDKCVKKDVFTKNRQRGGELIQVEKQRRNQEKSCC